MTPRRRVGARLAHTARAGRRHQPRAVRQRVLRRRVPGRGPCGAVRLFIAGAAPPFGFGLGMPAAAASVPVLLAILRIGA